MTIPPVEHRGGRVLVLIQARMGSTRLPGKVLVDLAGEPMLARVVARVRQVRGVDDVVVATTDLPADAAVAALCAERGWNCFRGSSDDVLDRYYRAAVAFGADVVVRITADCPLVDPRVIEQVLNAFFQRLPGIDYVCNGEPRRTFPRGLDTEVMRFCALARAWLEATTPANREHVTPYLYQHPDLFRTYNVVNEVDESDQRWTVDTAADLELVRRVYEHFRNTEFGWHDVLALLSEHPEWVDLNRCVPQKPVLVDDGRPGAHGDAGMEVAAGRAYEANKRLKGLIVGAGSIGRRHLRNLVSLGVGSLAVVEPDAGRRHTCAAEHGATVFEELTAGLAWGPDFVVIATPSHLHTELALAAARRGIALFVEKPLAHSTEGIEELAREADGRALVSQVGCNMRFHPGPMKVKDLLVRSAVGRVLCARLHVGSYLPEWRPASDYRDSYSAHQAMGGGCILDCIHEIDLACWYLGPPVEVFCTAGHLSAMDIDVEDLAVLLLRHGDGAMSEIHLDYLDRAYHRGCHIVGEAGSIAWDFRDGVVRCFEADRQAWHAFGQPDGWDVNRMYVDEMIHFLECLRGGRTTAHPIAQGASVIRLVVAAKESARRGTWVSVNGDGW